MIIGVDYGVYVRILICEVILIYCPYCPYSSYKTYNNVSLRWDCLIIFLTVTYVIASSLPYNIIP